MISVAWAAAALFAAADPPLTEARAAELALRESPAVGAVTHRAEEARALEDVAGRWNNPELRIQNLRSDRLIEPGLHQATYPDHPLQGVRVGVRWEPPRLGVAPARRAEAAADASRADADQVLARRATAARARALHATVRGLGRALSLARAEQGERDRVRQALERRVEQQAATALDRSAVELDALEAGEAVERLEIERGRAQADLAALLALPPGTALDLSAEGASRCEAADAGPLLARAAAADPRVATARAGVAAADAELTRRWLTFVPWPSYLQASYVFRGDEDPAYWTFQLGFELPLLDWKRAERRAFAARRERWRDEERAEVAALERDVRHAVARLAGKSARARRFRDAAAALEDAAARYDASPAAAVTVQAGQLRARALGARRAEAEAEVECVVERIEVDRLAAAGDGPPR